MQALSPTVSEQPRKWLALGVLAAGLSMIVLDGTIVGVALPRIIGDLHLDLTDAQWVSSLYAMVFAALLLVFGRLADRLGRRTVFAVGVAVFVVASIIAGQAGSGSALIASRALQGIGGAMILPATLSTVNATFRGQDRARAFGIWGAVMAGMAAVGPLLGGWLVTSFDWRWIFYVNVPLGVLILIGTALTVPQTQGARSHRGLDVGGLLTSGPGLALVVFGLIEGTPLGWWRPTATFTLAGLTWPVTAPVSVVVPAIATGVGLLVLFAVWERRRSSAGRDALLDLRLFAVPTFSWGNLTAFAVAAGEFALVFVLPLYLVNVLGLTVLSTGVVVAAMALGAFASGAQARRLATRLRPPVIVVLGLALELAGVLVTAFMVGPDTSPWALAATLVVYGVGLGLASAQLTSTVLGDVPTEQSGSASAAQSTARQLGSALGTAIAGSTLAAGLSAGLPDRLARIPQLPNELAQQLAASSADSAGGVIPLLRADGTHGPLGGIGPLVTDALSAGFADATRLALISAAVLVGLGVLGAIRVARLAPASPLGVPAQRTDAAGASALHAPADDPGVHSPTHAAETSEPAQPVTSAAG
ncbi:DHA2 family efflux MFS transporter permease subunit [Intrasporangium flavum]|uniref:DHA2 family efflux MFS transporter permease subunit n=1 Tax=Intrasporangium flavum TaxID=1428657 RepID=UPI0009FB4392|nr:DHA2 family efflux MFS transporter permease subunit [Intrasporangium flavum]